MAADTVLDGWRYSPLDQIERVLVSMGYAAILIAFWALAFTEALDADDAYQIVEAPLIALLGGTLAVAKDLVPNNHPDDRNRTVTATRRADA